MEAATVWSGRPDVGGVPHSVCLCAPRAYSALAGVLHTWLAKTRNKTFTCCERTVLCGQLFSRDRLGRWSYATKPHTSQAMSQAHSHSPRGTGIRYVASVAVRSEVWSHSSEPISRKAAHKFLAE